MYRKYDVYDGYEREKSGRKSESTVKSRTSHNRVTKNLYSDKFAAYLVRLLYFRRKKRTLLVAKNMNYIERECFAVVFFFWRVHALLLRSLSVCVCVCCHRTKWYENGERSFLIKCRRKEKQNEPKQRKDKNEEDETIEMEGWENGGK